MRAEALDGRAQRRPPPAPRSVTSAGAKATRSPSSGDQGLTRRVGAVEDHRPAAASHERPDRRLAEAGRPARHQRHRVRDLHGRLSIAPTPAEGQPRLRRGGPGGRKCRDASRAARSPAAHARAVRHAPPARRRPARRAWLVARPAQARLRPGRRRPAALRHRAPHAARRRGRSGRPACSTRSTASAAGRRLRGVRDHTRRELPRSRRAGAGARRHAAWRRASRAASARRSAARAAAPTCSRSRICSASTVAWALDRHAGEGGARARRSACSAATSSSTASRPQPAGSPWASSSPISVGRRRRRWLVRWSASAASTRCAPWRASTWADMRSAP